MSSVEFVVRRHDTIGHRVLHGETEGLEVELTKSTLRDDGVGAEALKFCTEPDGT